MNLNQNKCLNSNIASNMTVKVAKPIKMVANRVGCVFFFFFGMPIKTLGSLGKIRVGRVTGNTHIFFFGHMILYLHNVDTLNICMKYFGSKTILLTKGQL